MAPGQQPSAGDAGAPRIPRPASPASPAGPAPAPAPGEPHRAPGRAAWSAPPHPLAAPHPTLHPTLRPAGPGPLATLAALLFPPQCPACGAETLSTYALCPACFADCRFVTGPVCSRCGRPEPSLPAGAGVADLTCTACLADPPAFEAARAATLYAGAARRLVLALKHGDRLDTVPMLADWLVRAAGPHLDRADAIVPVPLHWRRRLSRRFNQSAELARALARRSGQPRVFHPGALVRARATPSQGGRDGPARRANLEGAIHPRRAGALDGRSVLLVDDVMTSGATLDATARAARAAGATAVYAVVIALVPVGDPHYLSATAAAGTGDDQAPTAPRPHPEDRP
ncbi:MAG: ComF family protein [Pseudomonadota bacterium]